MLIWIKIAYLAHNLKSMSLSIKYWIKYTTNYPIKNWRMVETKIITRNRNYTCQFRVPAGNHKLIMRHRSHPPWALHKKGSADSLSRREYPEESEIALVQGESTKTRNTQVQTEATFRDFDPLANQCDKRGYSVKWPWIPRHYSVHVYWIQRTARSRSTL